MATLRDRLWTFKAVLLVACAALVVGGLAGAAITLLVSDGRGADRDPQVVLDRHEPRPPDRTDPPGQERRPWQHPHFYWDDAPTPLPDLERGPDVQRLPPLPPEAPEN